MLLNVNLYNQVVSAGRDQKLFSRQANIFIPYLKKSDYNRENTVSL